MPRPGGDSDKLGNRYEGIWAIGRLLELAGGQSECLTVEPIHDDGTGIEFVVRQDDATKEFHSAKRQRAKGEWSLAVLSGKDKKTDRSILSDLFGKLSKNDVDRVCFVSSTGANDLLELTERAHQRKTLNDFEADLNDKSTDSKGSNALRRSMEKYVLPITSDWATAYDYLQRTKVVLIDEATLTRQVEQHIAFLVYRPDRRLFSESEVRVLLGDFVLSQLGAEIQAGEVWEYVKQFGYAKRDWAVEGTVRDVIRENNRTYVRIVERELINQQRIPRDEAQTLLAELTNDDGSKQVLVSAPAGVGKSCVLAQAIDAIIANEIPTLVIRMDRHDGARLPRDIGTQMGLPQSPAIVLAGVSHGGPSVLVVDQLDAVSQASGRYPHLWETFDALCHEVEAYPNMRLVVSCRDFDLQNDHRLRKLKQPNIVKHIQVQLLSIDNVDAALTNAGCVAAGLNLRQKQILQTPLHLFLFLDGLGDDRSEVGFQSIGELFDRYWDRKQKAVSVRLGHESAWTVVIDKVCEAMSSSFTVSVPAVTVDEWTETASAMQTEHVLVRDGTQLRFFHESFFDYAFARRFCASGQRLISLLLSGEQHLFRRSQVRQVLAFLRDHNRDQYLAQLRTLITNGQIRFHVKRMVFAWLGTLPDPSADEWAIVEPLLSASDEQRHILAAIRNSLPWFDRLHQLGVIAQWLESSDQTLVNWAMWLLFFDVVQKNRSEEIAKLLAPYRTQSPEWTSRLRSHFHWGHAHHTRPSQELFLQLLDDGAFDETVPNSHDSWWDCLRDAAKQSPLFALEAMTHWLDRKIATFANSEDEVILERHDHDHAAEHLIREVARLEPTAFANEILPRVVEIVTSAESPTGDGLRKDRTWRYRSNSDYMGMAETILDGLLTALQGLATNAPEQFESLTNHLWDTDWETITFLLLRSWSANPSRFSDISIHFLIRDARRLDVGYASWSGEGSGYAAISRESIQTCMPYVTAQRRQELELAIHGFTAPRDDGDSAGWTERLLLEACGDKYLSAPGQTRLAELRNKFPEQETALPARHSGIRGVVSPIPPEETKNFTDEQWLSAMHEYDYGWDSQIERRRKGSAVELSRVLEPEVRHDRRRFAALTTRMDDTFRTEYFDAILNGICGDGNLSKEERESDNEDFQGLETEVILDVIRRLHKLPNRPCGRSICRALEKISDRPIPDTEFELLVYYAIDDADPTSDHWLQSNSEKNQEPSDHAHFHGYNSVRGCAARTIEALLFADYSRSALLLPVLRQMTNDPSLGVRTCVFESLLPVLNHDRSEAVRLFLATCEGADPIFGCQTFENFIWYAASTHYLQLRDILQTALRSSSSTAVTVAARQVCLAALTDELAEADAKIVRTGTPTMRGAAAEVYAYNVSDKTVGAICRQHLPSLFVDESADVRAKAADCFGHLEDADLNGFVDLIRIYIESPAFPSQHDDLLRRLEDSTWQLPEITIRLTERFVAACGSAAGDISTSAAGDSPTVAKLVVRLYAQTNDDHVRTMCLDLIDEMERLAFYGIDSELTEHDR